MKAHLQKNLNHRKQRNYMNNLHLFSGEYYEYLNFLSFGNKYYILISKRLLFKPLIPIWIYLFCLFLVRNSSFFCVAVLPNIILFVVFLYMIFPLWSYCNFSKTAYFVFHCSCILILKIISIPISILLESEALLWTFYI
jgi:hypothetical protein